MTKQSAEHEQWHARWREGRIGFHEGRPNALLERHFDRLEIRAPARVFVPLCGMAVDLDRLHELGLEVVGIDLSAQAVAGVFARMGLAPSVAAQGELTRYQAGRMTLFAGDFFALTQSDIGPVDAIYDRAALVALPDDIRRAYAEHLGALAPTARQLLITFAYDQSRMSGPPFSVPGPTVRDLYEAANEVTCLSSDPISGPMVERSGGGSEEAWLITPRASA